MLGVGPRTRNEVVFALTGRFPVRVHLEKALVRYTKSLISHERRATDFFRWARAVERDELPEYSRYKGKTSFGQLARFAAHATAQGRDVSAICAQAVAAIRATLTGQSGDGSQRLSGRAMGAVWG